MGDTAEDIEIEAYLKLPHWMSSAEKLKYTSRLTNSHTNSSTGTIRRYGEVIAVRAPPQARALRPGARRGVGRQRRRVHAVAQHEGVAVGEAQRELRAREKRRLVPD